MSNSSGRQIEDQGGTSSVALTSDSRSRLRTRGGPGLAILGVGLTGALLLVALVNTFYHDGEQKPNANRPTQPTGPPPNNPTNTTQPTSPSQPNNPPRAFVGREERDLGRGFAVDTSSESFLNLQLDDIADGVFTTAGSSEARSESNQDG